MSAEVLRRAARLMRGRAEAASILSDARTGQPLPWTSGGLGHAIFDLGGENVVRQARVAAVPHIASWHPAVALAVAEWLDEEADHWTDPDDDGLTYYRAYLVATTYLGEAS